MSRQIRRNNVPEEFHKTHSVSPNGVVLSNCAHAKSSTSEHWTRGVVPCDRGDTILYAQGWVHRSEWIGLFRIYQDEKINPGLHPFAMVHIPSGANLRLYPNLEIANVIAEYLASYEMFCQDIPVQILPGYFTSDIATFMTEHNIHRSRFEFVTDLSPEASSLRTNEVNAACQTKIANKKANEWEPHW
jgi:hypothetical protein